MLTVLFVHGTGVRTAEFNYTLSVISSCFADFAEIDVAGCEWGKDHGARTAQLSIPGYRQEKNTDPSEGDNAINMWAQLLADPFLEIALLARMDKEHEALFGEQKTLDACHKDADAAVAGDSVPPGLEEYLGRDTMEQALIAVFNHSEIEGAWNVSLASEFNPGDALVVGAYMLSRAAVAFSMAVRLNQGYPAMPGEQRDLLVTWLAATMSGDNQRKGGLAASAFSVVMAPLRMLGSSSLWLGAWMGTAALRHYRSGISDSASLRAGDILLYQSRGAAIRQHIAAQVRSCAHPVLLLGHSLGGIACVDLLVSTTDLPVAGLVTVGSQAPYLYELGALWSMSPGSPLPKHFPEWLNFYDRNDMLSYVAAPVFDANIIEDVEISSKQPFPAAHSAYWTDAKLRMHLRKFAGKLNK